jgi:hypothetical protein
MGIRLRRRAPLVVAVLVVLLGGCGDGDDGNKVDSADKRRLKPNGIADMDPKAAVLDAIEATTKAGDLLYTGRIQEFFAHGTTVFDVDVTLSGDNCQLAMVSDGLGSMEVRLVGERLYIKGSAAALEEPIGLSTAETTEIGRRWVSAPRADDAVCNPVDIALGDLDLESCTWGGDEVVDETPIAVVRCRDFGFEHRIYLATSGDPLVVRAETVGLSGDHLILVDTDPDGSVEAPPENDVLDMTKRANA